MTKGFPSGLSRFLLLLALVLLGAGQFPAITAAAAEPDGLYTAHAIVTGQGEENRQIGFRTCLQSVVGRVSGDAEAGDDPRLAPFLSDPGKLVDRYAYRDLLEGVPIHDEQGTHDRPHDLSCFFRPEALAPVLAVLGRRPWLEARPPLALFLAVEQGSRRFTLSSDGGQSPYMVDSFRAAAARMAFPLALPSQAELEAARQGRASPESLAAARGGVPLEGSLVWSDADLGWVASWTFRHGNGTARWKARGVSFDEAFRDGVDGAAKLLSGNGQPEDHP